MDEKVFTLEEFKKLFSPTVHTVELDDKQWEVDFLVVGGIGYVKLINNGNEETEFAEPRQN